jgi:class 3 adenylate cyclase
VAFNKQSVILFPFRLIQFAMSVILIVGGLGFVLLFGSQFPHSAKLDGTWIVAQVHNYQDPILTRVAPWADVTWPSQTTSFLPLILGLSMWGCKVVVDLLLTRVRKSIMRWVPAPRTAVAGGLGLGIPGMEDASGADSERAREELLKRYQEIESMLKSAKRKQCTFLSVDVVGSTKMKLGERETDVTVTFKAYEDMMRKLFAQYGAWKQAWTPDGVMICFLQLDLSVACAQRIILKLQKFNEDHNRLRSPFRVRCGINQGQVQIFEDSKLEKIVDRVIDVAGHMQKEGPPDAVCLSAELYNQLTDKSGFRGTGREVDGYPTFEWSVESMQKVTAEEAAPKTK